MTDLMHGFQNTESRERVIQKSNAQYAVLINCK